MGHSRNFLGKIVNDFERKALQSQFNHIEGLEIVFKPRYNDGDINTVWTVYKGKERASGTERSDIEYLKKMINMDIMIINKLNDF